MGLSDILMASGTGIELTPYQTRWVITRRLWGVEHCAATETSRGAIPQRNKEKQWKTDDNQLSPVSFPTVDTM